MPGRNWMIVGVLLSAAAVGLGAYGAHGFPESLARHALAPEDVAKRLDWFETANRYHAWHAMALVLLGLAAERTRAGVRGVVGLLLLLGLALFSGALYGLALGGPKWLAHTAPFGGTAYIAAWIVLAIGVARGPKPTL